MNTANGSSASSAEARGLAVRLLLAVISGYRLVLSPLLGGYCRFVPSCSVYGEEALRRYGAARGAWLTVRRVLRCHPFHAGGYDPVR